jgi:hypothetical protein
MNNSILGQFVALIHLILWLAFVYIGHAIASFLKDFFFSIAGTFFKYVVHFFEM